MTNKETIERNIGLTFDFVSHFIENPSVVENLPEDYKLEFIEKDFPTIEKKKQMTSDSKVKRKYVRVRNTFDIPK